jgi:hypothetical protein
LGTNPVDHAPVRLAARPLNAIPPSQREVQVSFAPLPLGLAIQTRFAQQAEGALSVGRKRGGRQFWGEQAGQFGGRGEDGIALQNDE